MANVVVGKIGQKLIFDRHSKAAKRSNTNGNVGAYLFFKSLFENNPDDMFYVLGENDLDTFICEHYNVCDISKYDLEELVKMDMDFGIFNISLLNEQNPDNKVIQYLNRTNLKWILASDDPRCLQTKAQDITNRPQRILGQSNETVNFSGMDITTEYYGIEKASSYDKNHYHIETIKNIDFTIVANDAGEYDRIGIVKKFIENIDDVSVYGRVSKELMEENSKFKGELEFTQLERIMKATKITFLVPIKKGWVTSKYVEALMNDVLPIFYYDYNTELITNQRGLLDIVSTPEELEELVNYYLENENERLEKVSILRKLLVNPYKDGRILSYLIMKAGKEL